MTDAALLVQILKSYEAPLRSISRAEGWLSPDALAAIVDAVNGLQRAIRAIEHGTPGGDASHPQGGYQPRPGPGGNVKPPPRCP